MHRPLTFCSQLTKLTLEYHPNLLELAPLSQCRALEWLSLPKCEALISVSELGESTSLKHLDLRSCSALTDIEGLGMCATLQTVSLTFCPRVSSAAVDSLEQGGLVVRGPCRCVCSCRCRVTVWHGIEWRWFDPAPEISQPAISGLREEALKWPEGVEKQAELQEIDRVAGLLEACQDAGRPLIASEIANAGDVSKGKWRASTTQELERSKQQMREARCRLGCSY